MTVKIRWKMIFDTEDMIMFGDWVIKEPFPTGDRNFYPCKASIFKDTYEELT